MDAVGDGAADGDPDGLGEGEADGPAVGDGVGELLGEGDGLREGLGDADGAGVGVAPVGGGAAAMTGPPTPDEKGWGPLGPAVAKATTSPAKATAPIPSGTAAARERSSARSPTERGEFR